VRKRRTSDRVSINGSPSLSGSAAGTRPRPLISFPVSGSRSSSTIQFPSKKDANEAVAWVHGHASSGTSAPAGSGLLFAPTAHGRAWEDRPVLSKRYRWHAAESEPKEPPDRSHTRSEKNMCAAPDLSGNDLSDSGSPGDRPAWRASTLIPGSWAPDAGASFVASDSRPPCPHHMTYSLRESKRPLRGPESHSFHRPSFRGDPGVPREIRPR